MDEHHGERAQRGGVNSFHPLSGASSRQLGPSGFLLRYPFNSAKQLTFLYIPPPKDVLSRTEEAIAECWLSSNNIAKIVAVKSHLN